MVGWRIYIFNPREADPYFPRACPRTIEVRYRTLTDSSICRKRFMLQEFGDTMMMSAAPCRIRTRGRERAALHPKALPPAHEKRCDRRRAGTTATRPRPVPGSAAGESLGIRRVHHAGQDYKFSKARTNAYRVRGQSWSRWWLIRCGTRSRTTSEWTRRECAGRNGRGEVSAWGGRLSREKPVVFVLSATFRANPVRR